MNRLVYRINLHSKILDWIVNKVNKIIIKIKQSILKILIDKINKNS